MSEINENPQAENEENVVYEYVELEEGQELPEGYEYEYEYVEVPEGGSGEVSELDVVNQKAEDAPAEEVELASAAEIEAVLSPRNLEEEMEGTSVAVPVQEVPAMPAEIPVPVVEEPQMPQIEAPGSEADDMPESKLEAPQPEEITEDMPQFEIEAPAPEKEAEAGIPSLDSLLGAMEAEVPANQPDVNTPPEETVTTISEESAFIEPENIKFQNSDEDNEPKDWFDESHLKSGAEVGSVDIDAIVNAPQEEAAALSEMTDILSEMKAEIKEPEAVSAATVISEEIVVPEALGEIIVPGIVEDAPAPTVIEEEVPAIAVEPETVADSLDVTNDFSLDDLLNEETVQSVDALAEVEAVEEAKPAAAETPVPEETEEPGIPFIGEMLPAAEERAEIAEIARQEEPLIAAEPTEAVVEQVEEPAVTAVVEEAPEIVPVVQEVETAQEAAVPAEPVIEEAKESAGEVSAVIEAVEPVMAAAPVAAAFIDTAQEKEEIINPSAELPKISDCSADLFAVKALAARLVSKNDGIQSFKGTDTLNALALNDVDFAANELNAWNLVLFRQEIMPLTAKVSELDLPRNPQVNRFASLVKAGEQKAEFFNEDKLKIVNTTDSCVAVQGRFVCGDLQTNSGLIVNDMLTIPLRDFAGKELSFAKPASGLLSGPNGTLLYFFNLYSLLVPNNEAAKIDAEKLQYKISKWYSGSLNDKYFEFNAQSPSGSFEGNEEIKAIHVNVSNTSYGWNVTFDNGLSMNLRDLREYQTRFGKMPSPNGVISYGQTKLTFSNVERIVVYESAQYYFYS